MDIQTRISIERRIVRRVVRAALKAGYTVSIFDSEEWAVKRSTSYRAVMDNMMQTDEEVMRLRDKEGNNMGFIFFVYGNDGYDVICDYALSLEEFLKPINDYADKLANQYA
jgi:hypothetical protein